MGSGALSSLKVYESEEDVANVISLLDGSELNGNTQLWMNSLEVSRESGSE